MAVSSELGHDTGLVSIDQEKALDRIEHQYLWQTLAGFGFNHGGVRQGCSLSDMLYSIAIQPLLHRLRQKLTGVSVPACPVSFKMSAYADYVIVFVNSQKDIDVLTDTVKSFGFISSARVNWAKSEAVMVGERLGERLSLPAELTWRKGGLRYLGVFLGDETTVKKNWDSVIDKIKSRLNKWR